MKFLCSCAEMVFDAGDALPGKAHFIPDARWLALLEEIDAVIEGCGSTAAARESACMEVRRLIGEATRQAWQCRSCGRVYIDGPAGDLHEFAPSPRQAIQAIFQA